MGIKDLQKEIQDILVEPKLVIPQLIDEGGRPTKYGPVIIERTKEYRDIKRPNDDEVVPSIEGLSVYIKIARSTIYEWIGQGDKKEFSDIVADILANQGKALINNGLSGKFAPTITKVILTKHGYREGIEQTGKDGMPLNPTAEDRKDAKDAISGLIKTHGSPTDIK
ncbi:MAG: terminase small subunit [Nitrospiria bacterium]